MTFDSDDKSVNRPRGTYCDVKLKGFGPEIVVGDDIG